MQKVLSKTRTKIRTRVRRGIGFSSGYPPTPGTKTGQELNVQVLSRKWYMKPKPAIGVTISVVNGLHSVNGGTLQSGAITIDANSRYLQTMVMSDADEYLKDSEATVLISGGGGSLVFTATTRADTVQAILAQDGDGILLQDGEQLLY
jgi:hypothetical protein